MNGKKPLSILRDRYVSGGLGRDEFESAIFVHLRSNPRHYNLDGWERADFMDFLGGFYLRLRRAIDTYRETGADFDAYMHSIVRWASIEFKASRAERAVMEKACWRDRAIDSAEEREAEYEPDPKHFSVPSVPKKTEDLVNGIASKKQILMLALKCCLYVSDDFLARIAAALEMDRDRLQEEFRIMRERAARRMERLRTLEERLGAQYYRCLAFEARCKAAPPDGARKEVLEKAWKLNRARLESMRRRYSRMMREATNKEVAETLGIPKGTVDSSLHSLKKRASCRPPGEAL